MSLLGKASFFTFLFSVVAATAATSSAANASDAEGLKLKCDKKLPIEHKVKVEWSLEDKGYTESSVVGSFKKPRLQIISNSTERMSKRSDQFYAVNAMFCEDHGGEWNLYVIPFVRIEVMEVAMGQVATFSELRAVESIPWAEVEELGRDLETSFKGADGQLVKVRLFPVYN